MTRRKLAMVFLPAALVLALAAALAWLQHTEAGARWVWSRASGFVPGALRADDIRGNLRSGLTLHGVTFENENTSVVTGSVQLQLNFDLFPPAVAVEYLVVDRVAISERAGSGTAPEIAIEERLSALALPLPLDFASIRIGQLVYQRADGAHVFESSTLSFSGLWHKNLIVREAKLRTVDAEWKARGELEFRPPFPLSAVVNGRFGLPAGATTPPSEIRAQATLGGNLAEIAVQAEFDHPAASVQGHITKLLQEPGWELRLSADKLQWPLDTDSPQVMLQQVSALSSGGVNDYQLEADAALGIKGLPMLSAEVRGTGDISGLQIDRLHLLGEPGALSATGAVSWADGFSVGLNTVIDRLNPGQWLQGWPADQPLHGGLEAEWQNGRVVVRHIGLAADASEFSVHGNGVWDPAADRVTADLEWKSLRWPVGAGPADFSSEHGKVQVQGKPAEWSVAGSLQLQAGQWPDGLVTINGTGDLESIQLVVERGEVLGGSFDGQFSYRWAGRPSWSMRARAQDLDISSLNNSLPGSVSGEFSARGQAAPMDIAIEVEKIRGVVRGQPVTASGGISVTSEALLARDLQIQSGQSRLALDGSLRSNEGVRFSGRIDTLGQFIEGARGNIKATGRFSANPARPRLEMDLEGSDLAWDEWRIGKVSTRQAKDPNDAATTRFELTDVSVGDKLIDEFTLALSGQNPLDDIQVEARMGATRLEASLAGTVGSWIDLPDTRWSGEMRSMRIDNETLGFLNLEQAAALVVDSGNLDFGPACFRGSRNGRICFDQHWSAGEGIKARASLETISLNLLQMFLGTGLDFSQTLTGDLQWQQAPGKKPNAEVRVELAPGQIAFEEDESILSSGPGLLEFRIIDGKLQAGNLNIDLPGSGMINVDFGTPDISMGVDSVIDGRIQVELDRIEPLLNWIPELDSVSGTVNADMRMSGTLADPRLTGHALLVRGKIEHSAIGISISDITLAGAVYDFNYTEFNGSFTSGEGQGRLKASVKFDDLFNPEVTLDITGQNLNVINVPDMTVKVDPDLHLQWHDSLLNLDGRIVIPVARIAPRYVPSTGVSESQDLIITSGELPPAKETFFDRSRLRLNGSVVVELGKDVTVTLEPAAARLRGKATFTWDNNVLPVADGTYKLSGKVYAYGQLLEVTEGRVSFPDVPADNPHLNVNAVREIYGNVQVKQAGVHITGTLKRPVLEPYTTPATTRERALTLLVTGHDFDYEQGVGGVEVGMYLAPRLYVSYGLGLFETQSVISARYDLKNGFGIKATSGQRETGADISYTIER